MTSHLNTQFVVADGAHARWVHRSAAADDFATTQEMHAGPHAAGHPQGSVATPTGRTFAVGERETAAQHHHESFARDVADTINNQAAQGRFERLAIVAPSHTLNAITARLTPTANAKLFKTLAKDLAKTPDHELGKWLRSLELG